MQVLPSFDPSVGANGNINVSAADSGCKLLLYNLSIYAIQLNFEDGSTAILHAGEANYWTLDGATPTILWSFYSKLNITNVAISQITATLYRQDEEIEGTYPIFMPYQQFIGNTVNTAMGGSTTWQNDNNLSGTQVGETTVSGSPGSNIIVQNQGLIEVLQWVGGVLTQIFKTDPGAASVVKLGNTGLTTETLGNMTVDQVLSVVGNTSLSTLLTSGKATLNSAEITNNLVVDGSATFNGGSSSIDASNNFNGNAVNVNTVNAAAVNSTGDIVSSNNQPHQWKDSGGTARDVLLVDGSNVTILKAAAQSADSIKLEDHTGAAMATFKNAGSFLALAGGMEVNASSTVLNGGSSGTATLWQFQRGTWKVVLIICSNFKTGASNQTLALPVPFTQSAHFQTADIGGFQALLSSVAQTFAIITALANPNGTSTSVTTASAWCIGALPAFDTISFNSGNGIAHNGMLRIEGV